MKRLATLFLSALFLIGCSSNTKMDSLEETNVDKIQKINISNYFPPPVTRNQYRSPNDDGSDSTIVSIAKYIVGEENTSHRILEETTYAFGNTLTQVVDYTVTESQIVTDSIIRLMNKSSWESDGSLFEVTDVGATITVKAGVFEEVLIVKQTDIATGLKFYTYFAPNIGILKIESDSPKFGYSLLLELVSTDFTPYGSDIQNSESSNKENIGFNEDDKDSNFEIDEQYETSPISRAASGRLPEKTGKSSNLDANEYMRIASEFSTETLGQYLFHRPFSWEYEGEDIVTYFDYDISVKSDKNGLLKEIYFESTNGPGEEEFLISHALLAGLSPSNREMINDEILFSGKEGTTYQLGGFEVGIEFDENSFKFLAVAN